MARRILTAAVILLLTGCAQGVKLQPTRTITLEKLVWLPVRAEYVEHIELPEFPADPVTNQDLNDYRRAVEKIIGRVNADRAALRDSQR